MTVDYRLTLYAPRSEDATETTVLAPVAGAPHADPFQVATVQGLTGWKPYLFPPEGRSGSLDIVKAETDVGQLTLKLLDAKVATNTLERWVTAFFGDLEGRSRLAGCKAVVEERIDGGAWTTFRTMRVRSVDLRGYLGVSLVLRDLAQEMETDIFRGPPSPSVTYAHMAPLLPNGITEAYGSIPTIQALPGTFDGARVVLDTSAIPKEGSYAYADVVTAELQAAFSNAYATDNLFDTLLTTVLVRVEILSGTNKGKTFDFYPLKALTIENATPWLGLGTPGPSVVYDSGGRARFRSLIISQFGPEGVGVFPDVGASIRFQIVHNGPPTEKRPLLIDDVDPLVLLGDILDGKFGVLDGSGNGRIVIPRETFPALELPSVRYIATEKESLYDFVQKKLLAPRRIALVENANGRQEVVDLRTPNSLAGVPTITTSDLAASAPSWEFSQKGAVSRIRVKHYLDTQEPANSVEEYREPYPDLAPARIKSEELIFDVIHPGKAFGQVGDKPLEVDGDTFRHGLGEQINGQERVEWIRRTLLDMARSIFGPFGDGVMETSLLLTRSSANAGIAVGDLAIIDVDGLPDPASNRRGGARLGRCVGRVEKGAVVELSFVDMGASTVAVSPALGAPSRTTGEESSSVTVPVTLNGSTEPARVDFAVTPTSQATPPAEASGLWTWGAYLTATGNAVIRNLPAGRRIWLRGRSEPTGTDAAKLPSAWVASSPAYQDTLGGVPLDVTAGTVGPTSAEWTLSGGDPDLPIAVEVAVPTVYQADPDFDSGTSADWTGVTEVLAVDHATVPDSDLWDDTVAYVGRIPATAGANDDDPHATTPALGDTWVDAYPGEEWVVETDVEPDAATVAQAIRTEAVFSDSAGNTPVGLITAEVSAATARGAGKPYRLRGSGWAPEESGSGLTALVRSRIQVAAGAGGGNWFYSRLRTHRSGRQRMLRQYVYGATGSDALLNAAFTGGGTWAAVAAGTAPGGTPHGQTRVLRLTTAASANEPQAVPWDGFRAPTLSGGVWWVPCRPGEALTLSGWLNQGTTNAGAIRLRALFRDADMGGTATADGPTHSGTASTWENLSASVTVPDDAGTGEPPAWAGIVVHLPGVGSPTGFAYAALVQAERADTWPDVADTPRRLVEVLPAGSTKLRLDGLNPDESYALIVSQRDGRGGIVETRARFQTTAGARDTAPTLSALSVILGDQS